MIVMTQFMHMYSLMQMAYFKYFKNIVCLYTIVYFSFHNNYLEEIWT